MYSLGTAMITALMLLFMVGMIEALPVAVLGSVVLFAIRGLVQKLREGRHYWRVGSEDFVIWLVTLAATVLIDLDWGVAIGFLVTIHTVFHRLARAKLKVLGRDPSSPGGKSYVDVAEFPDAAQHRGVKVLRLDTALFFGSRERLYDFVKTLIKEHAAGADPLHTVVLDACAVIFIDAAGVSKMINLTREIRRTYGTQLLVAQASEAVRDTLDRGGYIAAFPDETTVFPTIPEAIAAGVEAATFQKVGAPARVVSLEILRHRHDRSQVPRAHAPSGGDVFWTTGETELNAEHPSPESAGGMYRKEDMRRLISTGDGPNAQTPLLPIAEPGRSSRMEGRGPPRSSIAVRNWGSGAVSDGGIISDGGVTSDGGI